MTNMRKFEFICCCFAALTMVSCGGDENDDDPVDLTVASSPKAFNYVTTVGNAAGFVSDAPRYEVVFDNNSKKAVVTMENIKLSESDEPKSYRFIDVPWTQGDGGKAKVIDVKSIVPDGYSNVVFDELDIIYYGEEKMIDNVDCRGLAVEYEVNGTANVTMVPYRMVCGGTTETLNTMTSKKFVSTKTVYTIDLDPSTMTADVTVSNASFDAAMPALRDMLFEDVNLVLSDGGFELHSPQFIPSIAGTPYPSYAISNFYVDAEFDSDMELRFRCMKVFSVEADLSSIYSPVN